MQIKRVYEQCSDISTLPKTLYCHTLSRREYITNSKPVLRKRLLTAAIYIRTSQLMCNLDIT
jgi:hypothetical protein